MYIGGTDETAMHHLVAEVLDNSMDEAVAGYASYIEIEQKPDNTLTIRDNGRGIPIDNHPKYPGKSALEVILTTFAFGWKIFQQSVRNVGWIARCRYFGRECPVRRADGRGRSR